MTIVGRGGQIRLEVIFYEYVGGQTFDPDQPITLDIQFNNVSVLTSLYTYSPGSIVRDGVGRYHLEWTVPEDADLGDYSAIWQGVIHTATVVGTEVFKVIAAGSANPGTGSGQNLGEIVYITFGGSIIPMCLDPDELVPFFPEANYLEISEAIRIATVDVQTILGLDPDTCPSDPTALEYIKAAAACALSKIYGNGDMSGPDGKTSRIQLGDLEVQKGSGGGFGTNRGKILPENALTWCELAAVLRKELMYRSVGFKAIVKGSNYDNPVPRRHFRPDPGDWPKRHKQGDLDDPPDTKNWRG